MASTARPSYRARLCLLVAALVQHARRRARSMAARPRGRLSMDEGTARCRIETGRASVDGAAAQRSGQDAADTLDSRSLVDLATDRLRAEILSGALAPGQRIVEESIGRRFGISRAPLREALRLLAQQGIVEHLPRRGVRVATWSPRDIRQLFELRAVLERHAVRSALPLGVGSEPDPLKDVRANLAAMRAAERRGDDLAKDDAHRAFHAAIVALADNRQLELALAPVLLKLQLPMAVNLRREAELANPGVGLRRHEALLEALETDEVDTVLAAMASHGQLVYLPLPQEEGEGKVADGEADAGAIVDWNGRDTALTRPT